MSAIGQLTHGIIDGGSGTGTGITVSTVTGAARSVSVVFSEACTLTPAGAQTEHWSVQTGVQVLAVTYQSPNTVVLTTSEQHTGTTYTLMVPSGAVLGSGGASNYADNAQTFTGVGQTPTIVSITPKNLNALVVRYSQPMDSVTATTKGNYSFVPALTVTDVLMQDANSVIVYTSTQLPRSTYTLTATGVLDAVGNSV